MVTNNLIALDIGDERVGIALARGDVRVPVVVTTLLRSSEAFWDQLSDILTQHQAGLVVLGLPRGLEGQDTAQTAAARAFGQELGLHSTLPIRWQDEALTSVKAEETLTASGKPYAKGDIDALAACYILSDYLNSLKVAA